MDLDLQLYSNEAKKLFKAILDGHELEVLAIQLKKIRLARAPEGLVELRIKGHRRFLIVFVYTSLKLEIIYVLSYHLERLGEPTPAQLEAVKLYAKEIKALEA